MLYNIIKLSSFVDAGYETVAIFSSELSDFPQYSSEDYDL